MTVAALLVASAPMRYNPALDGIRAIAVFMVIGYHVGVVELSAGFLGVDVFFVLSGYLITSILLREESEGGIRLGAFYLRRARRLYPALFLLVIALLVAGWIRPQGAATVLLYLSDYVRPPGALAHTWSLAVEEHYYLLWPLLLPFVAHLPRRVAAALLVVAYLAASVWSSKHVGTTIEAITRFDTRLSGLIFGALLAFLPRVELPLAALGAVLLAGFAGLQGEVFDRAFTEAATGSLILLSTHITLPWLTRQPLVYLGRISYGIYLYHWPVAYYVMGEMGWIERLSITLAVAIALAALSFHTIERWCRHRPTPQCPAAAATPA